MEVIKYSYELNEECIFTSGNVEMIVKLAEKEEDFKYEKTFCNYWFILFKDEPVAKGGNIEVIVSYLCRKSRESCNVSIVCSSTSRGVLLVFHQ